MYVGVGVGGGEETEEVKHLKECRNRYEGKGEYASLITRIINLERNERI